VSEGGRFLWELLEAAAGGEKSDGKFPRTTHSGAN
jgi:hypothetical protein